MILTGKLPAGTRLRQADLADQLRISRTPLREALMKLEQEGLITVVPRRGFQVVELKLKEALELYDVREVLDGLAARLLADRTTEQSLKSLQSRIEKMQKCVTTRNAHEWFVQHVAFHDEIYQATGNTRLVGLISAVRLSIQLFHPLLLTTPNRLRDGFLEHRNIFKVIQARDTEKAERLARLHIVNAKAIVLKVMASREPSDEALVK
jgi:DNA-binding GntR family transcriptional regulator